MATVDTFWNIGHKITKHDIVGSITLGYRKFRAFFGTSPNVCVTLWDMLLIRRPKKSTPEHLLWALMLLKQYNIESVNTALTGVSEKTFRRWSLIFVRLLSNLPVTDWEKRFQNAPAATSTFVSLDGDFRIMEPSEFDPKWWSHKFNGPGLRNEIAICVRTGDIVWAHGGVPCGEWPDLRLARNAFIDRLLPGEKAIADGGYRDHNYFDFSNGDQQRKQILARHETVNGRIKQFRCMKERFRHALYLHPRFFHAVVNLTQMMIENGEPLYTVDF